MYSSYICFRGNQFKRLDELIDSIGMMYWLGFFLFGLKRFKRLSKMFFFVVLFNFISCFETQIYAFKNEEFLLIYTMGGAMLNMYFTRK